MNNTKASPEKYKSNRRKKIALSQPNGILSRLYFEAMNILTTIDTCSKLRSWMSEAILAALQSSRAISEKALCQKLQDTLSSNHELHPQGWYDPPPSGLAALLASPPGYDRLKFDTLRKEKFWPQEAFTLDKDCVGIIYASPIDLRSGVIGDFGITIYLGKEKRILNHLSNCLNVLEIAIDQIEVGMEFRHVHDLTQKLISEHNLTNSRTITWTDKVGTNLGHTIPWSYEEPNTSEKKIISSKNLKELRELISHKRINVNQQESFKIPKTIAFTLEARLESLEDPLLPNTFYHLIVSFKDGQKNVLANFNNIFQAIGMSHIRSKY